MKKNITNQHLIAPQLMLVAKADNDQIINFIPYASDEEEDGVEFRIFEKRNELTYAEAASILFKTLDDKSAFQCLAMMLSSFVSCYQRAFNHWQEIQSNRLTDKNVEESND